MFYDVCKKRSSIKLFLLIIVLSLNSIILFYQATQPRGDEYSVEEQLETVDHIPSEIPPKYCDHISTAKPQSEEVIRFAENWRYPLPKEDVILSIPTLQARCEFIKERFHFNDSPLSDEEKDFPLAYGILVHRWYIQVYYLLSAIYHPQNAYCIVIDNKTSRKFKQTIFLLGECFRNVQVINGPTIHHCGNSVLDAVLSCLGILTTSNHPWKYYQYLSGVDLPLRTNAEMVRIFKRLNGSINAEVLKMVDVRPLEKFYSWIRPTNEIEPTFGLKLIKSSLSATFSRETARFFVNSAQSRAVRAFLRTKRLICPDEYFWLTLAGNPKHVKLPASFDANKLLNDVERRREMDKLKMPSDNISVPYYISRYQRWIDRFNVIVSAKPCYGKYVHYSCVFGVRDVPYLLERPELVVHKLYITYQPASFFCLYKMVRERALNNTHDYHFNDEPYGDIPGARIMRRQSVSDWANAAI